MERRVVVRTIRTERHTSKRRCNVENGKETYTNEFQYTKRKFFRPVRQTIRKVKQQRPGGVNGLREEKKKSRGTVSAVPVFN